jgi:hypothetical protein
VAKTKINKRHLLKKFVEFPKTGIRHFFSREMKLLNDLIERYSIEFVDALSLDKKYESMAIILCDSFKKEIDKRYKHFNYKIDHSKYEKQIISEQKFGENLQVNKKLKTIRDFLNG